VTLHRPRRLSAGQAAALAAIATHVDTHGVAPSRAELVRLLGRSRHVIEKRLAALQKKGFLRIAPDTARGLVVIGREETADDSGASEVALPDGAAQ
jgi:repressor LexA